MTCGTNSRAKGGVCAVAAAFLVAGAILSHRIEPGIRVQAVTLAGKVAALKFVPDAPEPHPVAVLGHGMSASKENMFRFAEALAHAGFVCYAIDFAGHGASPETFSVKAIVQTLPDVARAVGPVDVFVGHSMGGGAGGVAVREHGFRPRLFIALGADPQWGENSDGPELLLLAGRFEEFVPVSRLKARTDARLVLSPWSDHVLEPWDPYLVNAAVEAACAAVGKTPPTPPKAWIWRAGGLILCILGAVGLIYYTEVTPGLTPIRAVLIPAIIISTIVLAMSTYGGVTLQFHRILWQLAIMIITWLALAGLGRWRVPRWSLPALSAFISLSCLTATIIMGRHASLPLWLAFLLSGITTFFLLAATLVGWFVARRATPHHGNLAMAILAGYLIGQWMPRFL